MCSGGSKGEVPTARYECVWGSESLGARFRILSSALGVGEWSASRSGRFIPGQSGPCLLSCRLVWVQI